MPSDERRGTLHAAPTRRASASHVDVDREREEGKKTLTSPRRHQYLQLPPSLSQQRSRVPSIQSSRAVPTMAMVPRTGSPRGPALPDISRREDSMTKRIASPVVHRPHSVPDVAMDGGRIYEGAGQHHDKIRRDREGVKDEGGRQRQRQGRCNCTETSTALAAHRLRSLQRLGVKQSGENISAYTK
ncbi:hypothetical protein B0H13DRAFT_2413778 [Mycena leptocephala]|nr:hypothetical protein B0H13DRAFT_2413778 [Mycena leptocephala]